MKSKNVDLEDLPEFLCEHFRHLGCDVHPFLQEVSCLAFQTQRCIYSQRLLSLGCVSSLVASPHLWSFASVYYLGMSLSEVMIHPDAIRWIYYTQSKQFSSSVAQPFLLFLCRVSVSVLCPQCVSEIISSQPQLCFSILVLKLVVSSAVGSLNLSLLLQQLTADLLNICSGLYSLPKRNTLALAYLCAREWLCLQSFSYSLPYPLI